LRNAGRLYCAQCGDARIRRRDKTLNVKVPAGVCDGHVLRFAHAGSYDAKKDRYEDVHIVIRHDLSPHERVATDGSGDVHVSVPIALGEVLTGFAEGQKTVRVMGDTFVLRDDEHLKEKGTSYRNPNVPVVFRNAGIPRSPSLLSSFSSSEIKSTSTRGDLYITFRVVWPDENETEKEKEKADQDGNDDNDDKKEERRMRRTLRNINKYKGVLRTIFGMRST